MTSRITLCLVCLLVCSLLSADLLGLIPDPRQEALRGRWTLCETLAINCSLLASKGETQGIKANLDAIVERNDNIVSAAVRRRNQRLLAEAGGHRRHWDRSDKQTQAGTQIYVPIVASGKPWGRVEVRFTPYSEGGIVGFLRGSLFRMLVFVSLLTWLLQYLFLRRTLRQLDPSRVIPPRVRAALDTLSGGLLVLDKNERVVMANRAFAETIDEDADALQGVRASEFPWKQHRDGPSLQNLPWVKSNDEATTRHNIPIALATKDGEDRIFMVNTAPIQSDDGKHRGVLASFDDVTSMEAKQIELIKMLSALQQSRKEIETQNKELKILATRDPLTACLNRRSFFEAFERHWNAAQRYKNPLCCIIADIDFFKSINDQHGHTMGDVVLKKIGSLFRELARDSDVVCRYGGEEFCILVPHVNLEEAKQAGERYREAIENLVLPGLSVTASFGISALGLGATDPQQLLDQADQSLYVAKRNGRNQVVIWDPSFVDLAAEASNDARTKDANRREVQSEASIPYHAVTALLSALAYRDAETAAHSTRVADLSVALARGQMSVSDTYVLEVAALLHDIGKIGVPDSILLKPGPLTEEEWKVMSDHDHIGVEILKSSFASPLLADIAESHNAFYGGTGRRRNLPTGTDIPLGARILTIADSFDAMVSDRVYRKGRSYEDAFAELRRCAGSQFDPHLVEQFIQLMGSKTTAESDDSASTGKGVAVQIGAQIEQLARALDDQDMENLESLSGYLEATADRFGVKDIRDVARELKDAVGNDAEFRELVQLAHRLLDLCRATRKTYVQVESVADDEGSFAESGEAKTDASLGPAC